MARIKGDGKGRLGGRAKGTPNKITLTMREWLSELIDANRDRMVADLATLDAKDRLTILERFMGYVIPKQQSVRADIDMLKANEETIEERLRKLAEDNEH